MLQSCLLKGKLLLQNIIRMLLPAVSDALQGAGWHWRGVVVWNKRSSRPHVGRFRQQCEYILFGSKGRFLPMHRTCFPGVFDIPVVTQNKVHLTSKPVALVRELLGVTRPGALVLDPFIGGGTTAVAALETGRSCVGIELSEDYAKIARRRCESVGTAGGSKSASEILLHQVK